jgi:hypothetical protein
LVVSSPPGSVELVPDLFAGEGGNAVESHIDKLWADADKRGMAAMSPHVAADFIGSVVGFGRLVDRQCVADENYLCRLIFHGLFLLKVSNWLYLLSAFRKPLSGWLLSGLRRTIGALQPCPPGGHGSAQPRVLKYTTASKAMAVTSQAAIVRMVFIGFLPVQSAPTARQTVVAEQRRVLQNPDRGMWWRILADPISQHPRRRIPRYPPA